MNDLSGMKTCSAPQSSSLKLPRRLGTLLITTMPWLLSGAAIAQPLPDDSLGNESSLVTDDVINGLPAFLIEGGATRDSNLFHSFLEFNVDEGQRVYFASPLGIESILSRVTGDNPSNISGTLGVAGTADLFLVNPNGIVFGENATLDIPGSFYGTTADAIPLGDEGLFSATDPEQSTLLTVRPEVSFFNYLTAASGDIESRGALAAGENLTLAGNRLELQGQVAAGADLSLLGREAVQIRDVADVPFIGFAGGDLLVQGNEQVDIVALSHPDSGLYSYGDMVLRSANPVGGDAHYWSAGNFRVETLDGEIGDLFSPIDPIIRTLGDVVIDEYEGSSLHILAGGSVNLGTATITAPDAGDLDIDFLREDITLSDGTVVQVDGGAQPTLDVRAGVLPEALGEPPLDLLTGFNNNTIDGFAGDAFATPIPSTADITVGDAFIAAPGGLILLTSQYEPNPELAGNILVTGDGIYGDGIDARGFGGQGGAVFLDARRNIEVTNSFINTTGAGEVGDIILLSGELVRFRNELGRVVGAFSNIEAGTEGKGGNVQVRAANLELLEGVQLDTSIFGFGEAGSVILDIDETASFVGISPIDGFPSGAFSRIEPGAEGTGGNVEVRAANLEILEGAQLSTSNFGNGLAGSVILDINETVHFVGSDSIDGNPSGAFSRIQTDGEGIGGDVVVHAANLKVLEGAQLSTSVSGVGEAGNVILDIRETIRFVGSDPIDGSPSGAVSSIQPGGEGTGGSVVVRAANLEVRNGAGLDASTYGIGDAGGVILEIGETALIVGINPINGDSSGVGSQVGFGGQGIGGDIMVRATNLAVLEGAQLSTSTSGTGDAGSVILEISETARFIGFNSSNGDFSGAFSAIGPDGEGNGGNVIVRATNLDVVEGAQLSASNSGIGDAGSVILEISETASFFGSDLGGNASGANSAIGPDGVGNGGTVAIRAANLEVVDGGQLNASVFGVGVAGDVRLIVAETARFVGANRFNGSPSGAFSNIEPEGEGTGGNVEVQAQTLEVLDGAQLGAGILGTGDAGSVLLTIEETARFVGANRFDGSPSGAFGRIQPEGEGTGGNVEVRAQTLEVLDGAVLSVGTFGTGDAGSVLLTIDETARFVGADPLDGSPSGAFSSIQPEGEGTGGNIEVQAQTLEVLDGAQMSASTSGTGDAGSVLLTIEETARFVGANRFNGSPSGASSGVGPAGEGTGGNVEVQAQTLEVLDGGQLSAGTFGVGDAGSVLLTVAETARFVGADPLDGSPSGASSSVQPRGKGTGGNVEVRATDLEILDRAGLFSGSLGQGDAGNVVLLIRNQLLMNDGLIGTNSERDSGGQINIQAGNVILRNDSDVQTFVANGEGGGGNIAITADFVIALEDSDILAFSADGFGGNIDLSQTTLFSQNLNFAGENLSRAELEALDGNDRVDINATGGIASGQIFLNDSSFVENSLNELPGEIVDTATLTAGSCIARSDDTTGSFVITGSEGLPQQPDGAAVSAYPTGTVQTLTESPESAAVQEPQRIYRLADGRLVLSHDCETPQTGAAF